MAEITILIKDEPDGLVSFDLRSDPEIDLSDEGETTKAQESALHLLDYVMESAQGIRKMKINDEPVQVQNPRMN